MNKVRLRTESPYVGCNNPLFIIYDLNNHKLVKRIDAMGEDVIFYNGRVVSPDQSSMKNSYFRKIAGIGNGLVSVGADGEFPHRHVLIRLD